MPETPETELLKQAAERGDTGAAIQLASLASDRDETLRWLKFGASKGDRRAALILATQYHRPENWGGNYDEAFRYYKMAATSRDPKIRAAAEEELKARSGLVGPAAEVSNASSTRARRIIEAG